MPPSPTSTNYLPAGYCRCGYRTDPGVCPECGRTNRRMRQWNPKRRSRWLERAGIAIAFMAAMFFLGQHVLWNHWPLQQIHYLAGLQGWSWWADSLRSLGREIINHRTRQMHDLANARYAAVRDLVPDTVPSYSTDGMYWNGLFVTTLLSDDDYLVAVKQDDTPLVYGKVIQKSADELTVRIDWQRGLPRILPERHRRCDTYVRALLDNVPVLINLDRLDTAWRCLWPGSRGSFFFTSGDVLIPDRLMATQWEPRPNTLLLPPRYCKRVVRPDIAAYITEIENLPAPGGNQVWIERARLNVGSVHGVRIGLEFYAPKDCWLMPFVVKQADSTTCVADSLDGVVYASLSAEARTRAKSLTRPVVGTLLRTDADW